jgi:hypothetical protein
MVLLLYGHYRANGGSFENHMLLGYWLERISFTGIETIETVLK